MDSRLRTYQQEDVVKLMNLPAAGVFNEQRTGKTPTALMAMVHKGSKKNLIIVPASLLYPWRDEYARWTGQPCNIYAGTAKQRHHALDTWTDGLVMSYEMFKGSKTSDSLADTILKHKPTGLIVDEAHRLAGRKTLNFKSIRRLVKIPNRLYLSGTPAPNKPEQIWSILTMIDPKGYSSYWAFIEEHFNIELERLPQHVAYKLGVTHKQTIGSFKPGAKDVLAQAMESISVMRKRADVMPWLPKQEAPTRVRLPLNQAQTKALYELEEFYETGDVMVQGYLDRVIRYRQICQAPALLGLAGRSPKVDWLLSYISDYPDKQVVVFSRFTQLLKLIAKESKSNWSVLDGDATPLERGMMVKRFQDGHDKVLLIQVDAGKEGLTLDNGDALILLDAYPPVADLAQAKDRIIATQEHKVKPQEVIELMMQDSYDEYLYDLVDSNVEDLQIINSYAHYLQGRRQG